MQQSSMILFCEECGAANEATSTSCLACQYPLTRSAETLPASPNVAPVHITAPVVRTVVAGAPGSELDLLPGTLLFGRYQICREIGRGGFSIVYLAEDLRAYRKPVAIKRIYLRTLTARQVIDATETWNREVKMLSFLQSVDGVPRYYESFTDPENWYLAMEYIQGQTLEEYMQKAPGGHLSEAETLVIGGKLVGILQNLHNHTPQVIFRDVKPSNIMITPEYKLYLIDFGIARFFTPGQKRDTTPLGSPGYAPLEQYGRAQTDARSDIYSLGATLQTLLMGRDPLELAHGEPSYNPKQPSRHLRKLFARMLNPQAGLRPASIGEIKRSLQWIEAVRVKLWRLLLSVGVGAGLGVLLSLVFVLLFATHIYFMAWGAVSILRLIKNRNNRLKLFMQKLSQPFLISSVIVVCGIVAILCFIFFGWF